MDEQKISGSSHGQGSMTVIPTVTRGHTGRTTTATPDCIRAESWSDLETIEKLKADPAFEEFQDCVAQATLLTEDFPGFRGCDIDKPPPTKERMGPRPLHLPPQAGRYSVAGTQVLYLSESEQGVLNELEAWHFKGEAWVQPYILPANGVRIADFSDLAHDSFLTCVFSKAEECNVEGRETKKRTTIEEAYLFSNLVASVVSQSFDGMLVPGVRAKDGSWYRNVVMFSQHLEWRNWLDGDPRPLKIS